MSAKEDNLAKYAQKFPFHLIFFPAFSVAWFAIRQFINSWINSAETFSGKVRITCPRLESAVQFWSNAKRLRKQWTSAHLSDIQSIIHSVFEWSHFNFSDELFLQKTKPNKLLKDPFKRFSFECTTYTQGCGLRKITRSQKVLTLKSWVPST